MNHNYQTDLAAVYESVINEVMESCREMFADERVDEAVLDDMKAAWLQRMNESGALPTPSSRVTQQQAMYMPMVAQKGQASLIAGQSMASGSRITPQQPQPIGLQTMVMGQQRIISQAAYVANTAIRSQLKPLPDAGMLTAQSLVHQQQQIPGRNVISAVIVPVTKSSAPGDMKQVSNIPRRAQLDGRYDSQASSSRGGSSREPPEKKFARSGLAGPVSDESDLSDTEISGFDDLAAAGADDGGIPASVGEDEEPLNSGDDVSEAEEDVFDCPNLLVCQYDKVNRAKSKWRFSFRDAILLSGQQEYLFSRITGEAEFS